MNFWTIKIAKFAFNAHVRAKVWRKLAAQLRYGISFYRAIEILQEQAEKKGQLITHIYDHILKNNASGGSLAQSLNGFASSFEIMVISAGEQDNLAYGLELAADLLTKQSLIKQEVLQSTIYPCFLLSLVCALLVVISKLLVPQFAAILPPDAFVGAAYGIKVLADFVGSWQGVIVLGLSLLLLFLALVTLPSFIGPVRKILDDFMPWSIYREVVGAGFLYSLGILMHLGVKPRQVFAWILQNESQPEYLKERILAIDLEMAKGKNLGEALNDANYNFPSPEAVDDILAFASLPNLEKQIADIAKDELADCLLKVQRSMKILQISLLAVIAAMILFVLVATGSMQQALSEVHV